MLQRTERQNTEKMRSLGGGRVNNEELNTAARAEDQHT